MLDVGDGHELYWETVGDPDGTPVVRLHGGSWGVALGLAYAQRHPERVRAMVFAAVTSARRVETDWITRDMRRVFPREGDGFAAHVPEPARDGDLAAAYATLLADADPAVTERAAEQWCRWEDVHVSTTPRSPRTWTGIA